MPLLGTGAPSMVPHVGNSIHLTPLLGSLSALLELLLVLLTLAVQAVLSLSLQIPSWFCSQLRAAAHPCCDLAMIAAYEMVGRPRGQGADGPVMTYNWLTTRACLRSIYRC